MGAEDGVAEQRSPLFLDGQVPILDRMGHSLVNVMKEIKVADVVFSGTNEINTASKDIMNLNAKMMVITG